MTNRLGEGTMEIKASVNGPDDSRREPLTECDRDYLSCYIHGAFGQKHFFVPIEYRWNWSLKSDHEVVAVSANTSLHGKPSFTVLYALDPAECERLYRLKVYSDDERRGNTADCTADEWLDDHENVIWKHDELREDDDE